MSALVLHFCAPGSSREVGCSALGGAWTTAFAAVTCSDCRRLYAAGTPSTLEERRQRAREAAYDAVASTPASRFARVLLESAIETATRVKLTPEIDAAAEQACGDTIHDYSLDEMRGVLAAAFRAAGFEVEE